VLVDERELFVERHGLHGGKRYRGLARQPLWRNACLRSTFLPMVPQRDDGVRAGDADEKHPRTLDIGPSGVVRTIRDETAAEAPNHAAQPAASPGAEGITTRRKALAFAIAALSDAVSFATGFAPPAQLGVDAVTAVLLFWVLGFRWQLLPALVAEAIPVVAAFPTWTLAVGVLIGVTPTARKPA
jgi:hypothetical protein